MDRVPLRNVVTHLVGTRSDLVKVANRLHTRIDVEWPSLERWLSNPASTEAKRVASPEPKAMGVEKAHTHVLRDSEQAP